MSRSLKLAIDGVPAAKAQKTGVEWYVWHLLRAMNTLRPDLSVTVYTHRPLDFELKGRWQNKVVKAPRGMWKAAFSFRLIMDRPDILFVPGDALPLVTVGKTVTTIHDLAFLDDPTLYNRHERVRQGWAHKRAVKKAARLIAVSGVTKQALMRHYGVDERRVHQVPLAIDTEVFHPAARNRLPEVQVTYNLPDDYFVFVGRLDERKGVADLIRTFIAWRKDQTLVLIGRPGEMGYDEIHQLASHDGIRELGYINANDTATILSGARAFLFPTKKEGFGIPILEAMAVGTTVICSDLSVLREVGGDVPIFVKRDDVNAWQDAFNEVMARSQRDRIARGFDRTKWCTWEATARATLSVLCNI
ncbi:MAG: glycosyltransferase family 1 protein [Patescibacteria group bacterium]